MLRGQEHAEQVFDLAEADPDGEGDRGELALFGLVQEDPALGLAFQFGDPLAEPLILLTEFDDVLGCRFAREPLLDLAGVLVDGLAAAAGLFGLLRDSPVLTRKDGGGVEDPDARR